MNFAIDSHSPLPPHAQIIEQIKVALLLGRLRPGDTLPSIRDVESETGISRNVVRRAYLDLQKAGILTLRHGKGVLVQKHLSYAQRDKVMKQCERLSRQVLERAEKLGLSPSSFARYLYQQARGLETQAPFLVFVDATKQSAQDRAAMISNFWQVHVRGVSIEELSAMNAAEKKKIGKILTNYMRLEEVSGIVKNTGVDVIPLGLSFMPSMLAEFEKLPSGATVVLILDDRDFPMFKLLLEGYRKILVDPSVQLSSLPLSKAGNLSRFVKSARYDKVIISNRIWDDAPASVRDSPRVTRPKMEIDLASLESARIRAGVIV